MLGGWREVRNEDSGDLNKVCGAGRMRRGKTGRVENGGYGDVVMQSTHHFWSGRQEKVTTLINQFFTCACVDVLHADGPKDHFQLKTCFKIT